MRKDLVAAAEYALNSVWSEVVAAAQYGELSNVLDDPLLLESIRAAVNSRTKTYRYVLPTQLAAKVAEPRVDSRCLQASRGGEGAFDARTVAHKVVVPFDQENERVLGGSVEPYVNNPLRVSEVSSRHRAAQKNQTDWDHLCTVLNEVERQNTPLFSRQVLKQTLIEVYRRLSQVKVAYPAPLRISLDRTIELVEDFLSEQSGGDRLLALTSALFATIGRRFGLFLTVQRASITAADAATGLLADLECISENGETVLAVEVKDRELTVSQLRGKLSTLREKRVAEIFVVAQRGVAQGQEGEVQDVIAREFVSGQNIYTTDLVSLARSALALTGEQGRREFLAAVGEQLDGYGSDISHRRAWAALVAQA